MPYRRIRSNKRRTSRFRRGTRRYKTSRKYKRKLNRGPRLSYVGPGRAPLPDTYFTKLTYSDYGDVAAGGVGVNSVIFRGNNAADATVASGGRTCSGWTELASIYQSYRVYGSKIRVRVKSLDDTVAGDLICMLIPVRSSTPFSLANVLARTSAPFSKMKMMNRGANGNTPTYLQMFRKTKNIFGETSIDDPEFAGTTAGTAPTNAWFWHVIIARGDKTTTAVPAFQLMVDVTYYVRFESRNVLGSEPE